jgi:hypothetical protein
MSDFLSAARWTDKTHPEPHQIAAWNQAWERMSAEHRKEFLALFRSAPATKPPAYPNPLRVPYFSQRDSDVPGQAMRMCFSSSCAMLTAYLRPGSITGPNADDQYLKRVMQYGDSTDANAQIKALHSFGITARFITNGAFEDLERQIQRGIPIPCGFLHHGSVANPSGGGHWLCAVGITPSHVIVNDPFGEMDLAGGTYPSPKGAGVAYSRARWGPRWMAEGARSGWAIIAER